MLCTIKKLSGFRITKLEINQRLAVYTGRYISCTHNDFRVSLMAIDRRGTSLRSGIASDRAGGRRMDFSDPKAPCDGSFLPYSEAALLASCSRIIWVWPWVCGCACRVHMACWSGRWYGRTVAEPRGAGRGHGPQSRWKSSKPRVLHACYRAYLSS
jgi:hypothetical protein